MTKVIASDGVTTVHKEGETDQEWIARHDKAVLDKFLQRSLKK